MSPRRLLIFALLSARASRHGCRAFTVTRLASLSPSISHLPSVSIESVPSAQGDGAEEAGETAANAENVITVALTRELGKNSKLRDALEVHPAAAAMGAAVVAVEIPCIEHAAGADAAALADLLSAPAKDGGGPGSRARTITSSSPARRRPGCSGRRCDRAACRGTRGTR